MSRTHPLQERHWDSTRAASLPGSLNSGNSSVTQRTFDKYGNVLTVTDPNLNVTKYIYDTSNLYPVTEVEASGSASPRTFQYTWDYNIGLKTSRVDVDNSITSTFSYDPLGRQTQYIESTSVARQVNTIYDDANLRVITKRDINLQGGGEYTSVVNYDQLGRVALTQLLNTSDTNAYDLTNGLKVQTRYQYSGNNLYKLESNPFPEATVTSSPTDCYNRSPCTIGWTLTQFDQEGRPVATTTYDGSTLPAPWGSNGSSTGVSTVSYSAQVSTSTDAAGKKRQTTVDGLGRLSKVVEDPAGLGYSTSYQYDVLDDLTNVTQAQQTRTFVYDSLKRLGSSSNPESGSMAYTYDANGNLLSRTDNRAIVTSYGYDALNRLVSKTYPTTSSTPNVTYNYCNSSSCGVPYGVGRVASVSTSAGNSFSYAAYDTFGRVLNSSETIAGTNGGTYPFAYSWALTDNLDYENYPSGRQTGFGFGYVNYPQSVFGSYKGTSTGYVAWFGFGGYGELSRSMGSQNALIWNRTYNNRGQDISLELGDWNTSNNGLNYTQFVENYSYGTTNNNGNLASTSEAYSPGAAVPYNSLGPWLNDSYTYDGVNRLASVSDPSYTRSMCYDAYGNGWVTAATGQWAGNTPSELGGSCPSATTPYTGSNRLNGNNYDGAGNQTTFGGNTLVYDAENRLVTEKSSAGAVMASYQYDGDGHRISKTVGGVATNYVYDALGRLMAEYVNGALSKEYIRMRSEYIPAGSDLVAIENAPGSGAACATCLIMTDDLGSIRVVTDLNGNIISRHDYLAFGEEAVADGNRPAGDGFGLADGVSERFTGKERDGESGLDYFGARYYGSALGRFTSPDPSNLSIDFWLPQTWNRYAYALNNPLSMVDRNGLWPTWVHNEIINEAFPGLSKQQLQTLKTASKNVDSDQSLDGSYKHGMADGNDTNGAVHAQTDSENFIKQNEQNAEAIQADWVASGHTGIAPGALTAFGNALHTITDETSPSHEYFQPWYGTGLFDLPEAGYHFVREAWPWGGNPQRQQQAVQNARIAFLLVFGNALGSQATQKTDPEADRQSSHSNCLIDRSTGQCVQ